MIFQYPSFLWALSALAVPIIIHLFNFRKTTPVFFSNTRFLKQVKQETTQKRKLKQYLVLASRLLFLFFLVMAFAQPFLPASDQVGSQKKVAIYLDNSLSMSVPAEDKKRALDVGIQMVQGIVETLPLDMKYQLITNDFAPFSNSFKAQSEVIDFLSKTRLSAISRNANEITNRLLEKNTTLFWISDLQRSTFGNPAKPDSSLQIKLAPVKYKPLSNVFVDSVFVEKPLVAGGDKNSIKVRLRNIGDRSIEGLVTKLLINSNQASAATTNMEPNSYQTISFDLATTPKGLNRATINFSDFPVSFDNEFYFTLNYTTKLKVVEIKNVTEPTSVERVYGNKELFSFSSFQAANLNYSLLRSADLIVVNGLNKIEPSLLSALKSIQSAHSIVLIPGQNAEVESYRSLVGVNSKLNKEEKLLELDLPDFKNPFFQNVFEEKNNAIAMPVATKLLDWGSDRTAILQFKDGRPFLSQFQNVFVFACPFSKGFTDFYSHALFVPVMYRVAYTAGKREQKLYYSLSSTVFSIEADSLPTGQAGLVGEAPIKMVGKQEVIPLQRRMENQVTLEVPKFLLEKGFYSLLYQQDTLDLVAFNVEKEESVLQNLTGEEAKVRLGGGSSISIFDSGDADSFRNEVKQRYLGTALWKYALLLALFFLLAEVLLLRFLK
jgi:hypothetical protein